MIDPLREEAKAAIEQCHEAGIRTIMITGDQPVTATEIARQLGLDRDNQGRHYRTVHARELDGLDDAGWQQAVAEAAVFARVSPEHKLRIVEALASAVGAASDFVAQHHHGCVSGAGAGVGAVRTQYDETQATRPAGVILEQVVY